MVEGSDIVTGVTKEDSGRFLRRAVKVEEAQRRVLAAVATQKLASEQVALAESSGRRLAKSLSATSDWPPFARSGLDGYAVRAADTALATPDNPALLRVVASVAAGSVARVTVEQGTAARIMTGAAVPEGADAVVMLEQTAEAILAGGERAALIKAAARSGQNVAPRGEEFRLGSLLAGPGAVLKPGHIALLGTFGYADVPVYRRPRVAVFATGSELLPVRAPLAPGRIRDSNSYMVAAMIKQSGAEPLLYGVLPDEPEAVSAAFAQIREEADIILTTGGVSVGDYDVLADIFRGLDDYCSEPLCNSYRLFNRVAMRPGSPTSAAVIDGKLVIALSGNPSACFVGFELFARPAIRAIQGEMNPFLHSVRATLATDIGKGSPHVRYVRIRLQQSRDGSLIADPLAFSKSSMMASIADAEGLAIIPSGAIGAKAGEQVEVLILP
ncbi:molybdopterin molybdotransferase MoeA [Paenibacillus sp. GSMTC-2017]|uniref:molybdopterin molybdotransferase MoeA n=1 Tax=Paenibacillus sp. GSMTC-2017 TaxID=2794350 RepID=UPI002FBEEEBD